MPLIMVNLPKSIVCGLLSLSLLTSLSYFTRLTKCPKLVVQISRRQGMPSTQIPLICLAFFKISTEI